MLTVSRQSPNIKQAKALSVLLLGISATALSTLLLAQEPESDPPEIAIGDRLFIEPRFAQAYYARPDKADPALEYSLTVRDPLRGPYAGQTMNCRACHLVDELGKTPQGGNRTYADFAHVSPVPARNDKQHFTSRNSMQMVGINQPGKYGVLLHFDGEFNSMQDLVSATFTGRNFGWLVEEHDIAIKHMAKVIREDDGQGELAKEFGGSYKKILTGTAEDIPPRFRLPPAYRVDVANASDTQIFEAVVKLVAAYVDDLTFREDAQGRYNGSPYDQFLMANDLPRAPREDESLQAYSERLFKAISMLNTPKFIIPTQGKFDTHKQVFEFGQRELQGMKLFFSRGSTKQAGGNCVSCHSAPHFSDFAFHNSGLTQINYDEAHGQGSFQQLHIPDLKMRNRQHDTFLPVTPQHPKASERFRSPTEREKPGYVDLGMWNIFANPDFPGPQKKLFKHSCDLAMQGGVKKCSETQLLPFTIASFKTPLLRDLGHSEPYMHTGQFTNLTETVALYIKTSALAKAGLLRNADQNLKHINITQNDVTALVAFLNALNEDYD
jgi:cytochrome c peroxidase